MAMASNSIQQTTRRICQIMQIHQRRFSNSSKVTDFTSKKATGSSTVKRSQGVVAEPTSILSRITQTTQRSLDKAKQSAKTNLQNTEQSLKDSISSAARSSKDRITNESYQYMSHARSSIHSLGQMVKTSAIDNINNTKNIVQDSISNAANSSKERIKHELSSRLPFKSLPDSNTVATKSNEAMQQSISKSTNAANFATKVISETTSQAASNMTSTVKESVSKATRWLWWWGLAAVGVYGMSTTLTKEGVQVLKDLIVGDDASKSSKVGTSAVKSNAGADDNDRAATPTEKIVDVNSNETWLSSIKRYFRSNQNHGE